MVNESELFSWNINVWFSEMLFYDNKIAYIRFYKKGFKYAPHSKYFVIELEYDDVRVYFH